MTTVITQRDDSVAVICLHRKPHTKSREKKAGYQPAQQTKEEKKEGRKRNLPPLLKRIAATKAAILIIIDRVRRRA